jgi:osmotically-inducible protein OsmY
MPEVTSVDDRDALAALAPLDGTVHAWHEKQVAQEATWSARGVSEVEDHVMID